MGSETTEREAVRDAVDIAKRYHASVQVETGDDYAPMHRAVGVLIAFAECSLATPTPAADGEAVVSGTLGAWSEFISRVVFYARATARSKGYALAVHGSLFRDLDVVAVPWTDEACSAQQLAEAIHDTLVSCEVAFGWTADCQGGKGHEKPNGRMAWSITLACFDGPKYLDLSVAPLRARPALPEEVKAAVEDAERIVEELQHEGFFDDARTIKTLLAHLTRGAQ